MATEKKTAGVDGTMWGDGVCSVCGATEFVDFLEIKGIPAQDGVLWPTHDDAVRAPRGDIRLSLCLNCSFAGNRSFEPALLKFTGYNVSAEHSPLYQAFIKGLATDLIERYSLRNKTVLDIGCGNGYFLKTICALGGNRGVGFDPSYTDVGGGSKDVQFFQDYYSEKYSDYKADLVCCRQVVDHLGNPRAFLKTARRAIGERPDTVVYFEVPNPERRLLRFTPWQIGYEHGSWFFAASFRRFFEVCGFEVKRIAAVHSGDYLGIEAVPVAHAVETPVSRDETGRLADQLKTLSTRFHDEVSGWRERLDRMQSDGVRAIPWGAGEHGIGFMSILDIRDQMPYIIDINPHRVGKFIPGTGQKVVAPEFLAEYKPDVLIITNRTYEKEIQEHARRLGSQCEFLVL
jgi:SAM-dependent methyltransferase